MGLAMAARRLAQLQREEIRTEILGATEATRGTAKIRRIGTRG
jgi:hypothetical protein